MAIRPVRSLKGPQRPLTSETDRAEILAALACIDYVTIFHAARVTELIREVRPHVYAKGGDYTIESMNPEELAALRVAGAEIRTVVLIPGKSTTSLLEKIRAAEGNAAGVWLRMRSSSA